MSTVVRSWGRFPSFPQSSHEVAWREQLPATLAALHERFGGTLAYGNGRSYGDSCMASSDHVLRTAGLDRFIAADWEDGTLIAEAGVTLGQILAVSVPRGWFLPVVPGTQYVTLGGAVANDIHGKNHHVRGSFGRHVLRFGLVRSGCGERTCSSEENAELFCATIGGLGLTGVIAWVQVRLLRINSGFMDVSEQRFGNLGEFFALSNELDSAHEYAVSWLDCLARGAATGRGVYTVANHAPSGPLTHRVRAKWRVPLTPPFALVNALSLRVFNTLFYRARNAGGRRHRMAGEPFFFPLDRILEWNRLYGPGGFQQFQCVFPESNAEPAVRELLGSIAAAGAGSFLAVMKRCGGLASPGYLSFPLPGVSLALDFPQNARLVESLFPRFDAIVREAGGRFYPAKDAHMSAADFKRSYPNWHRIEALRDPALSSRFWQRVIKE